MNQCSKKIYRTSSDPTQKRNLLSQCDQLLFFWKKIFVLWILRITMTRKSGKHLPATYGALNSCFDLIRSHQQCTPWSPPLEIEPTTTVCRSWNSTTGPLSCHGNPKITSIPPFKNYIIIYPAHEAYVMRTWEDVATEVAMSSVGITYLQDTLGQSDRAIHHRLYVAWTGGPVVKNLYIYIYIYTYVCINRLWH